MLQPIGGLQSREPLCFIDIRVTQLLELPQRFPHHVDVMDIQENQFGVLIGILGLVS